MARKATLKQRPSFLLQTIVCLFLLFAAKSALALDELFEIYNAPQALAMGNAFSADASGYASLFYNPAGLAKNEARKWEITPIALDGIFNGGLVAATFTRRSLGLRSLLEGTQTSAGTYQFLKGTLMPSVARRGFSMALIGNQDFAALSDGTQVDVRAGNDLGIVFGGGANFASNMLKIGFSAKTFFRNQLKGTYAHAALGTDDAISSLMKEGLGIGADLGAILTLPMNWLPTLGVVWKDIGTTRFLPMQLLNSLSSGTPDSIPQSFNVAMSVHPAVGRGQRLTISAEMRHIEKHSLAYSKRLHFGFQYMARKSLFLWLGMNQMFPTFGAALRVRGGDFEVGTYAQDIGVGTEVKADRRFFFRYTIGF